MLSSAVVSAFLLAAAAATLVAGPLREMLGRRHVLLAVLGVRQPLI